MAGTSNNCGLAVFLRGAQPIAKSGRLNASQRMARMSPSRSPPNMRETQAMVWRSRTAGCRFGWGGCQAR
ncbi:MAG: hypothetical protein IPM35_02435 [Myxococcales bacterium]|nr:hypothetical protein [Myxococcales bacterium]